MADEKIDAESLRRNLFEIEEKPVNDTRFKKGQSGNPKGRPRKQVPEEPTLISQSLRTAVLNEGRMKVSAREGDKMVEMTKAEALVRSTYNDGIRGKHGAQRTMLELGFMVEREQALEIAASHAFWVHYKEVMAKWMAQAEAKGEDISDVLPHPDDVVLEPGKPARFIGPTTPEERSKLESLAATRETLLLHHELDDRLLGKDRQSGALLMFIAIENQLPKRYRWGDGELVFRQMRIRVLSKRELLKRVREAWARHGNEVRRGQTFPSHDRVAHRLLFTYEFNKLVSEGKLDPAAICRGEFDDAARAFFERYGLDIVELRAAAANLRTT